MWGEHWDLKARNIQQLVTSKPAIAGLSRQMKYEQQISMHKKGETTLNTLIIATEWVFYNKTMQNWLCNYL